MDYSKKIASGGVFSAGQFLVDRKLYKELPINSDIQKYSGIIYLPWIIINNPPTEDDKIKIRQYEIKKQKDERLKKLDNIENEMCKRKM